jgi:hypothetical protein
VPAIPPDRADRSVLAAPTAVISRITTAFEPPPVLPNGRLRPSRAPRRTDRTWRTEHSLLIRYYDPQSAEPSRGEPESDARTMSVANRGCSYCTTWKPVVWAAPLRPANLGIALRR